jgi:hypothetical protein
LDVDLRRLAQSRKTAKRRSTSFGAESVNPFTATPFFLEKDDFEINAQKILEEFCLQFFLCVWMGKWLDYGENILFCILHN